MMDAVVYQQYLLNEFHKMIDEKSKENMKSLEIFAENILGNGELEHDIRTKTQEFVRRSN